MCQSKRGNPAAITAAESERLLSTIARLLNVPLSTFVCTTHESDGRPHISMAEPSELLKIYLDLPPEPRRELLAHARRLAHAQN